jgi:hypothetical protein
VSGPRWNAIQWVASVAGLSGTIAAVVKGFAPDRFRPAVGFAVLWAVTASGAIVGRVALRRRAARLKNGRVSRGVRLVEPIWLRLPDVCEVLAVAGPLGAVAAVTGYPGVGGGIVFAIGAMCVPMVLVEWFHRTDLTFEPAGLRVDRRHLRFFIAWPSIVDVWITPAANPPVNVQIADPVHLLATVDPDTPRNRSRLQTSLAIGSISGRSLVFHNWTAGLDSATLARAVRDAMGSPPPPIN